MSVARLCCAALPVLTLGACGSAPTTASVRHDAVPAVLAHEVPAAVPLRLPADVVPLRYDLTFDVNPREERFSGSARIDVQLPRATSEIRIHSRGLVAQTVRVARKDLPQAWINGRLQQLNDDGDAFILLDRAIGPGTVQVDATWTAPFNPGLDALYRVKADGADYAFTQFEAIAARGAFPCFDEPAFKTPFGITLVVHGGDKGFANTREVARSGRGDVTTLRFADTVPLPTYLVAFAVGPLDVLEAAPIAASALRKEPIPLRGIAVAGRAKQLRASLEVARAALGALESRFGVAYPFDKLDLVAVPDFDAGAMENAGFVTFKARLLFVDDASPLDAQRANVGVIAHELSHQWFGDLVTPGYWDDIWLNEAFASWMGTHTVQALRPDFHPLTGARRDSAWVMHEDSLEAARRIRQPIVSKSDIDTAFDGITYEKGESVITMIEAYVGAERFRAGVQSYVKAHAFGTGSTDAFIAAIAAASDPFVAAAFPTFLDQPGVPAVDVKLQCAGTAAPRLALTQHRFLPTGSRANAGGAWQLPFCARYDDGTTSAPLRDVCVPLTGATGDITLALPVGACPKLVHGNRDGVGYYRFGLPAALLASLSAQRARLTEGERVSATDAIEASLDGGTATFADALTAALPFTDDADPGIMRAPLELLARANETLLADADKPALRARVSQLLVPIKRAVGPLPGKNEDPRVRERRRAVYATLFALAEDAPTVAELAGWGRRALGLAGASAADGPVDLRALSLSAALRTGGEPELEAALALLRTADDVLVRRDVLRALGAIRDPGRVARVLALTLDPLLRIDEMTTALSFQLDDPLIRPVAWAWLKANVTAVHARLPEGRRSELVTLMSGACTDALDAEVAATFAPLMATTPGLERMLAQTQERIALCSAAADRDRASAHAFVAKR